MINTLLPHSIGISVSYPLPGTKFYENVKADLTDKTNWTDSNAMSMLFKNTYRPAFYKQLYSYVHASYRKQLALNDVKALLKSPASVNLKKIKKALSVAYYETTFFFAKKKLTRLEKLSA